MLKTAHHFSQFHYIRRLSILQFRNYAKTATPPKVSTRRVQCGFVGLPNVGKSTIFNALGSSVKAEAANFPFCTIEPNVGLVEVPDERLYELASILNPKKVTPATMKFVDIAGIVKDAHKGAGLGNKFLSHIREVDALCHVVRCFESDDIAHVDGSVDPVRDAEVIEMELILKDLETCEKMLEKANRVKSDKQAIEFYSNLYEWLSAGNSAHKFPCNDSNINYMRELSLLTKKPMMYLCNLSEDDLENKHLKAMREYAKEKNVPIVSICGEFEAQLAEMPSKEEREEFLKQSGLSEPGLNPLIRVAYDLLGLITFFTVGEDECKAWTCPKGITAPKAAGKIHTDFEKGFVRAEVFTIDAYRKHKTEQEIRKKGLFTSYGKDYIVQDGDIIIFRANTRR